MHTKNDRTQNVLGFIKYPTPTAHFLVGRAIDNQKYKRYNSYITKGGVAMDNLVEASKYIFQEAPKEKFYSPCLFPSITIDESTFENATVR